MAIKQIAYKTKDPMVPCLRIEESMFHLLVLWGFVSSVGITMLPQASLVQQADLNVYLGIARWYQTI